jgi:molecular chaperone HtpG
MGDLDLGSIGGESEKETESQAREFTDLVARIQDALKDRASAVRLTHRLTDSPACLVSDTQGISTNLERLLKASGQKIPSMKPVLEINPNHPIVERLKTETDDSRFSDWSHTLFDQATLAEGGQLEDPATFVKRLNTLMLTLAGGPASRIWTPGS